MKENNLMEGLNEGAVVEVYENVAAITYKDVLKVAGITTLVVGAGYLMYKGGKKVAGYIKNKRNAQVVEAEYVETESEK